VLVFLKSDIPHSRLYRGPGCDRNFKFCIVKLSYRRTCPIVKEPLYSIVAGNCTLFAPEVPHSWVAKNAIPFELYKQLNPLERAIIGLWW